MTKIECDYSVETSPSSDTCIKAEEKFPGTPRMEHEVEIFPHGSAECGQDRESAKRATIRDRFNRAGISCDEKMAADFLRYHELLIDWNERINLTAITEFEDVVLKHFTDCLLPLTDRFVSRETICRKKTEKDTREEEFHRTPADGQVKTVSRETSQSSLKAGERENAFRKFVSRETLTVIDVGTGAGFPGIPLGIAHKGWKVTLLDSLNKRVKFLNEVKAALELKNVETVHSRAEDGAMLPEYREKFDMAVSRAVASLPVLLELCLPYVKTGGYFIAYKSGAIEEEAAAAKNALKQLGGEIETILYGTLPGTDMGRSLVVVKKTRQTPKKYPRKAGTPSKNPL